ncbi:hypothetical protein ACRRTK_019547 [Alexandromys fortis]
MVSMHTVNMNMYMVSVYTVNMNMYMVSMYTMNMNMVSMYTVNMHMVSMYTVNMHMVSMYTVNMHMVSRYTVNTNMNMVSMHTVNTNMNMVSMHTVNTNMNMVSMHTVNTNMNMVSMHTVNTNMNMVSMHTVNTNMNMVSMHTVNTNMNMVSMHTVNTNMNMVSMHTVNTNMNMVSMHTVNTNMNMVHYQNDPKITSYQPCLPDFAAVLVRTAGYGTECPTAEGWIGKARRVCKQWICFQPQGNSSNEKHREKVSSDKEALKQSPVLKFKNPKDIFERKNAKPKCPGLEDLLSRKEASAWKAQAHHFQTALRSETHSNPELMGIPFLILDVMVPVKEVLFRDDGVFYWKAPIPISYHLLFESHHLCTGGSGGEPESRALKKARPGKDGRDSGDGDGNDGDIRKAQLTAVRFAVLPFYRLFCSTIEHYELYVKTGMLQVTEELLSPRGSEHCTQMIKGTNSALRSNALMVQARCTDLPSQPPQPDFYGKDLHGRESPRHGMMSWELPLSEMKGMRHSPLALGSPAGAPREKAADPEAQAGEKPVLQSRGTRSPQLAPTPYCATAGERAEGERLDDPSVAQNHSHSVQKGLNARVASTYEQSMP